MATPRNDAYSCASGASIFAGILPRPQEVTLDVADLAQASSLTTAFITVPQPGGSISNLGTSKLDDVHPLKTQGFLLNGSRLGPVGTINGMMAYCSAIYAPYFGVQGSLVFDGGGHDDYWGNEIYRFDINSRTWTRLDDPTGLNVSIWRDAIGNHGDTLYGEDWADNTFTTTTGRPTSSHSYVQRHYLAPGVGGTNPAGSGALLSVKRSAISAHGSYEGAWTHIYDLDSKTWSRFSTNRIPHNPFEGLPKDHGTAYDSVRGKVYAINEHSNVVSLDLATKAWGSWTGIANGGPHYNTGNSFGYIPGLDLLITLFRDSSMFKVIPAGNLAGGWRKPGFTNAPPTTHGHWTWDPDRQCIWFYPTLWSTQNDKILYKLTPPADPLTQPWVWSTRQLTGVTPNIDYTQTANGGGGSWRNFHYIPALQSALWFGSTQTPVQQFSLG